MLTKVIKIHSHKTKKFMTKNKLVRSHQEQKIDDNSNGQLSSILWALVLQKKGMPRLAPSRYHLQVLPSTTLGGWQSRVEYGNWRRLGWDWEDERTTFRQQYCERGRLKRTVTGYCELNNSYYLVIQIIGISSWN